MAPPHRSRHEARSNRPRAVSDQRGGASGKSRNAKGRVSMSQYYDNAQLNQSSRIRSVGDFVLGKTIGEGTFGKVKLGKHMVTTEKVAIKILERSRMKDTADVTRVTREIKILKRNIHPNVIQLYEVIDSSTAIYLIMEHIDGGELFDYIVSHQRLQEPQACFFFHQICDGLEYLHRVDVTHRDLKPENLLLQSSPKGWIVKIVDFGLSNTHEGGRLLVTACGSPCYAAPEMIAGKKYVGPKADMWSLGVVLYAMVCGYLPFEESTTAKLYQKILAGDYKAPNFISKDVRNLIKSILNTDPKRRYYVTDVRRHGWYNIIDMPANSIIKHSNSRPEVSHLDEEVMFQLQGLGLDRELVTESVCNGVHNTASTSYYLMAKKLYRQGRKAQIDPAAGISPSAMPSVVNSAANSRANSAANLGGAEHSLSAVLAKMNMSKTGGEKGQSGGGQGQPQPQRRRSGMQEQPNAGPAPPVSSSGKEDVVRDATRTPNKHEIPKIPISSRGAVGQHQQRPRQNSTASNASHRSTASQRARVPSGGATNRRRQSNGSSNGDQRRPLAALPWAGKGSNTTPLGGEQPKDQRPGSNPGSLVVQTQQVAPPRPNSIDNSLTAAMPGFHPSRPTSGARSRLSSRPPSRGRNNNTSGLGMQNVGSSGSNGYTASRPASNRPSRTASPRSQAGASPTANGMDSAQFRGGRKIIARPTINGNTNISIGDGKPSASQRGPQTETPTNELVPYKKQSQVQPPAIATT
mmetsp:Transcript_23163/g.30062  ORF Transcript_23163/g.30062 Transcript_23163/m.30062 type:complete len:748 (+) Transcript_23163:150-2393(+)